MRTVGLLQASPAIGSLLAFAFSGWVSKVRHQGRAIVIAVVLYGASVAAFGFARALWIGVLFLAMSGAADMVSAAYRSTMLQVAAPDNLRGRLQGVFTVVVAGGPRMGDFVMGSTAALFTPTIALAARRLRLHASRRCWSTSKRAWLPCVRRPSPRPLTVEPSGYFRSRR